ncbi:porin family protein [Flagellimonas okinawensis]|uniref:Porin family protein n=1 Tax=Flagellimonas okinawensis TaxID=3031324 RepID=A0ABT5XNS7_9FLAO|nr:porin family protein [[Muricauda] okinawensis]MDF0707553.1 porin family protein [[Muricauda] okinawensis]
MMLRTLQAIFFIVCLFLSVNIMAQGNDEPIKVVDERYLEDQFYIGVGYNVLFERPDELNQRNLSYNLQTGFIKDIPFNKKRNFGVGIGLGYAINAYYSNLVASEQDNMISYEIMGLDDFNRSKLATHSIELPFEVRWRTSTAEEYKFWRVYAGLKFSYVFSGRSKLVTQDWNDSFSNDHIDQWQYGLMLNFGYNTWNVHAYYGLNSLLTDDAQLNGNPIDLNVLRIGLIFYIL